MIIGSGSDPQQFFRLVDFHRGAVVIIVSLNCVTSALSFGPGLFRKAFACSTRISFVSVPSNFTVPSIKSFSGMARGSLSTCWLSADQTRGWQTPALSPADRHDGRATARWHRLRHK